MTSTYDVYVGVGAAAGSLTRYHVGRWISQISNSDFPWGTWFINVVGSCVLGLVFKDFWWHQHDTMWWLLLGTGFCGGFTTFSTMSYETMHLMRTNRWMATAYLASSLGLGCVLIWAILWV
ncbi:fluoride efflux transporter CrcB [Alicyclobacillus mengziensis]|uniref:Fluoride-specific ion channel FluC n=1 Tax=Alicyclobacillus mengziensis TaxID=2931921 RepID=A0A9X7VVR5_9BACL|nr:fluoride efflux transporter CrcB [Alicyclobacillus mengziensis]QSO45495.1 fluoride efflux transporter CrcB [Alicyclobacillus mengziensis]